MFDKDFKITGKHASYWKDLSVLAGNVKDRDLHSNFKIFDSYISAYITCPIIGYQYGRRGVIDNTIEDSAGMLAEVITKRSNELKYVYQIIMLVDEDSEPDVDKRVYRAFNFSEKTPEDKGLVAQGMKIFNSYFLGGLEVLHEIFVDKCIGDDSYMEEMYKFVSDFNEEQDAEGLKASIDKIINK